ncbi:MFS transporter [Streptomyces sp. NPDC005355]|uniref:MFS transporter n=1 Tax=Streptomyces sp. NPDC005355 TaxID=3157038 RepID=UPI0033B708E4
MRRRRHTAVQQARRLCGAVATPLFGRLGDMYGRRRMLLTTLVLLVAGSVLGALSTSLTTLMIARVLQGISAATVPLSIGAVRDLLPREKMATGIGILSATMGIGVGLGMIISGLVAQYTSGYRIVFWLIAGLSAAATAPSAIAVRDVTPPSGGQPDIPGAIVFPAALVCLLLAVSQGRSWGWTSAPVISLLITAVILLVVWIVIERRSPNPLVDISMLTHRGTIGARLASFLLGFALYAGFTLLPSRRRMRCGKDASECGVARGSKTAAALPRNRSRRRR